MIKTVNVHSRTIKGYELVKAKFNFILMIGVIIDGKVLYGELFYKYIRY